MFSLLLATSRLASKKKLRYASHQRMPHFWRFTAKAGNPALHPEPWIKMIDARPELAPVSPVECPNPFKTDEEMIVYAPETSANLLLGDEVIGSISWALDDTPRLILDINDPDDEPEAIEIARELAELMGAELHKHHY